MIRQPRADELPALSALCLRSKGHWGYDAAFLEACRDELTIREADLARWPMAVLEEAGVPVGLVQIAAEAGVADLMKIFVDPAAIGRGHGARLFDWAVAEARARGAERITIEADPGAAPFYESRGARIVGEAPSGSIPGRVLPLLELSLS